MQPNMDHPQFSRDSPSDNILPEIPEDSSEQFYNDLAILNRAITKYAVEVLKVSVNDELRNILLRNFCNLSKDEILKSPHQDQIEKIRNCALNCFQSRRALGDVSIDKSALSYVPHPLFETISQLGSNKVGLPCEVANITALSPDLPMIRATHSLNLVASSIGMIKTMKDAVHSFYEKVQILKLNRQITALEKSSLDPLKREIEIESLRSEIASRKVVLKKIKKNALPDALLNSTYFTGSVVGAALDPSLINSGMVISSGAVTSGAIVSASIGGVAFGAGMLAISIKKMIKNIKKQKKFNIVEKQLLDQKNKIVFPKNQKVLDLKLSYLRNHQRNKLKVKQIRNALNSAVGVFSMSTGVVSILIASSVVVSVAAISATGIGLAVAIGLAASVCVGVGIRKYYHKRKAIALEKDAVNYQTVLVTLERVISDNINAGNTESLESLMGSYQTNKQLLFTAKANAALKNLLTVEGKEALNEVLKSIDSYSKDELLEMEEFLGIEYPDVFEYQTDMYSRMQNIKQTLVVWVRA